MKQVQLITEQERYPLNSLGTSDSRTNKFVQRCLDILAPLFGVNVTPTRMLPKETKESNGLEAQLASVDVLSVDLAEAFLFGFHSSQKSLIGKYSKANAVPQNVVCNYRWNNFY